jgi:hypothetical protein
LSRSTRNLDGGIGYQPSTRRCDTRHYPAELLGECLSLQELDALFQPVRDNSAMGQVLAVLGAPKPTTRSSRSHAANVPALARRAAVTTSGFGRRAVCSTTRSPWAGLR